jgi:hypothetical protein
VVVIKYASFKTVVTNDSNYNMCWLQNFHSVKTVMDHQPSGQRLLRDRGGPAAAAAAAAKHTVTANVAAANGLVLASHVSPAAAASGHNLVQSTLKQGQAPDFDVQLEYGLKPSHEAVQSGYAGPVGDEVR